jgi:hypothetical protein
MTLFFSKILYINGKFIEIEFANFWKFSMRRIIPGKPMNFNEFLINHRWFNNKKILAFIQNGGNQM